MYIFIELSRETLGEQLDLDGLLIESLVCLCQWDIIWPPECF